MGDTMTESTCKQTIRAVAAGRLREAPPMVACTVDDLAAVLPGLDAAADNPGTLGRTGARASWRAVRQGIAGQVLRVWHDGGRVLAIELERPEFSEGWPALRDALGSPSQQFDVFRDVVKVEGGLWLYAARGVAMQTSLAGERVDRVMVFPPMAAEDFVTRLALSLAPPREHPAQ